MSIDNLIVFAIVAAVVTIVPKPLSMTFYPGFLAGKTRREKSHLLQRIINSDRFLKVCFYVVDFVSLVSLMIYLFWAYSFFEGFWPILFASLFGIFFVRDIFFYVLIVPIVHRRVVRNQRDDSVDRCP